MGLKKGKINCKNEGFLKASEGAPSSIGEVVEGLLKKLGLDRRYKESQISFQWQNWVGGSIAAHARPYRVVNKKLVVHVDNSVWLSELSRYYKTWILKRIQTALGEEIIHDLIFKVGEGPSEEPKSETKRRTRKIKKKDGEAQ